jgi:hypothetical protein
VVTPAVLVVTVRCDATKAALHNETNPLKTMQAGCQVPRLRKIVALQWLGRVAPGEMARPVGQSGKSCRANVAGAAGKSY